MHNRNLGPFSVSALGLGCMNVAMGYGDLPTDDEAGHLFNCALDAGYTFFDTAAMYGMGRSESILGRFMSHRRDQFVLASKCGIFKNDEGQTEINGRPEVLMRTCEESLKRLNTEAIDLYYLHRIDPNVPLEESVGALSIMVEQGKVQTIGLSEVSSKSLRLAHDIHPITAVQSEYSLWSRTPERKMLDTCRQLGITFVPFSPLARQFLTGRCPTMEHMSDDDLRRSISRPRFEPANFAKNQGLLKPFGEVAEELGLTMAQLALAWLLAQEDLIPIPGTKNSDHLMENAAAGDVKLDAQTVSRLDRMINDEIVCGRRYTDTLMTTTDSEKD